MPHLSISTVTDSQDTKTRTSICSYRHILEGINTCDVDLRQKMYQNILVVGGNTMIPGFTESLEKLLYSNSPESTKVKI